MHTQQQHCTMRHSSGRGAQHPAPSDAAGALTDSGAVAQASAYSCMPISSPGCHSGSDSQHQEGHHTLAGMMTRVVVRHPWSVLLLRQVHYTSRDRPREQAAAMRETGALRSLLHSSSSPVQHFPWHRLTPGARFTAMVQDLPSQSAAVHVNHQRACQASLSCGHQVTYHVPISDDQHMDISI